MIEVWQNSVAWTDPLLMSLSEHLFVAKKPDGWRGVNLTWGHEYCEAHENWKLHLMVFMRDRRN